LIISRHLYLAVSRDSFS